MIHKLKCWPEYFDAIGSGLKTFDVRRDDRHFQVNHFVELHEFKPCQDCGGTGIAPGREPILSQSYCLVCRGMKGRFTGRIFTTGISYVLPGGQFGIAPGYCVLALWLFPHHHTYWPIPL